MALNHCKANVQIKHMLYGNQKLNRRILRPFVDGGCVGLIFDDEKKYITMDELSEVYIDSNKCVLRSAVMELYIDYSEL